MAIPEEGNQRWSLDFVSCTRFDERRFRILCVIESFRHAYRATIIDNALSGESVAQELDAIAEQRGYAAWWSATMGRN